MHNVLAEFFKPYKDGLNEYYQWKFDEEKPAELFGIKIEGSGYAEKSLDLRRKLNSYLKESTNDDQRQRVANYYIKDWGGIRSFAGAKELVERFKRPDITIDDDFDFKSISSCSKYLSILCNSWACIYDARVAYAINTINYIRGGNYKIYPMPKGRNTKLELLNVETLLLADRIKIIQSNNPKDIRKNCFVDKKKVYNEYSHLIKQTHAELWGSREPIQCTEMLLFSLSDNIIFEELLSYIKSK